MISIFFPLDEKKRLNLYQITEVQQLPPWHCRIWKPHALPMLSRGSFYGACSRAGQPQQAAPCQAHLCQARFECSASTGEGGADKRDWESFLCCWWSSWPCWQAQVFSADIRLWSMYKNYHIKAPDEEYHRNKRRCKTQRKFVMDKGAVSTLLLNEEKASCCL